MRSRNDPQAEIGNIAMAKTKVLICPYCGETQPAGDVCRACGGLFEPMSRQATHNAMGPWFIRDPEKPFQPGCSYDTLTKLVQRGVVTKLTIVRGPTTKQYWTVAKRVAGISHLLGYCHQCDSDVKPSDHGCPECGAVFGAYLDRNYLGLPELRAMPWEESVSDYGSAPPPEVSTPGRGSGISAFQASPPPGRISSFATNEELRGEALERAASVTRKQDPVALVTSKFDEPGQSAPAAIEEAQVESADEPVASAAHSAPEVQPIASYDDAALRTARRRALQYQKTGQRLWIALAFSVVLNVALASVMLTRGGDDAAAVNQESSPTANSSTSKNTSTTKPVTEPKQTAKPTEAPVKSDGDGDAAKVGSNAHTESESAKPVVDSSVDPETIRFETLLDEAHALIEKAQDESRGSSERISDYESAIQKLNEVRINAPASVRPNDIADQIAEAQRELERLKLREFFP